MWSDQEVNVTAQLKCTVFITTPADLTAVTAYPLVSASAVSQPATKLNLIHDHHLMPSMSQKQSCKPARMVDGFMGKQADARTKGTAVPEEHTQPPEPTPAPKPHQLRQRQRQLWPLL